MDPLPPLTAIAGGLLIGTTTALYLLLRGRIAGVSGMTATATGIGSANVPWSEAAAFLVGLPLGALLIATLNGTPVIIIAASTPVLIASGLLVGFGTRLGNGCTSGHGICGIARLSLRSLAATATFMATAAATVFIVRHVIGG